MEIAVLKNQIKSNKLQSFYIFSGIEWKVQQIYIDQIAKISGNQKKHIDSIASVFSKLKNRSFVKQSFVYVVRDDKELMNNEKLQDRIETVIGENILILIVTNLDKRTKFYKRYANDIFEFEQLKPAILKKYIQKVIDISDKNCEKLMEICEYDYGRCLLEVDKIWQYVKANITPGQSVVLDKVFEKLLEEGAIYQPPKDAIFDFVNAVLKGKVKLVFNLLQESYASGEATMVLLSVLYTNVRQVLQIQTCQSSDIAKSTGLTGWQIKCAKENCGYYEDWELERMLQLIHKCERGIKTGAIDESVVMEYILVHIL